MKKLPLPKKDIKLNIDKRIILCLVGVVIICGLVVFLIIFNNPSNKLKRYLIKEDYTCNKSICRKDIDNVTYNISYKKASFQVITGDYILNITKRTPYLVTLANAPVCRYEKENYKALSLIDSTYSYSSNCSKYIKDINKYINEYQSILDNSKVTVDELSK